MEFHQIGEARFVKKEDSFVLRKKDHFYGGNGFITQEGGNREK